ncbi:hypothetical protein [Pontibacter sp. SGAir0037]|uniref:hypothetical protein n=1 Tax=Pontibacter sp. SGAir0037 TaxID=2571030 RepID=UPI0010CCE8FD|nr:hypothetical protein [Pontibacter sp. SGAir0037]QCR23758.1 hypothetical protein C1N53_16330 [Pontibacter sp. SGAir0037]
MILFENSMFKLDYDPASDILEIDYPDLQDYLLREVKHTMDIVLDIVRNYNIRHVLFNSTAAATSNITVEESRELIMYFATGLVKTRLVKLARIRSADFATEARIEESIKQAASQFIYTPFELQDFTDKGQALDWLVGD